MSTFGFVVLCKLHKHCHSDSLLVQLTLVTTRWPLLRMSRQLRELEQPLFWLRTRYGWWKPDFRCVLSTIPRHYADSNFRAASLFIYVVGGLRTWYCFSIFQRKSMESILQWAVLTDSIDLFADATLENWHSALQGYIFCSQSYISWGGISRIVQVHLIPTLEAYYISVSQRLYVFTSCTT